VHIYTMILPKDRLPKEVKKRTQVKPTKAARKEEKKQRKLNAANSMDTEPILQLTVQQKVQAKMERKAANKHNLAYKKFNSSMTHFYGPRAVTK